MRSLGFAISLLASSSSLGLLTHAQLVVPFVEFDHHIDTPAQLAAQQQALPLPPFQHPMAPAADPFDLSTQDEADTRPLRLNDLLNTQRPINLFAGFTRALSATAPLTLRLESTAHNTTILAPANPAILALPRKPWEDSRDADDNDDEGSARANRNLQRFVDAHVVPVAPWREGEKVATLAGKTVWWERQRSTHAGTGHADVVIMPDGVAVRSQGAEVDGAGGQVVNGEVWVLTDVLQVK